MEKQKTSSKRKAAIKVIVAVLLVCAMTGISFAVANFVHNRKSVQASSVKNGLSAYELAVQQGYAGSLDDWLVSLQGKSAYQIAVDNGYSGSEKDWSKTLTAMSKKDKSDISSAAFSEKGDLVITLSDGTKINVGKAVGASGKDGKDGKDGIGIKSAKINDKGELVISYSDGNSVNLDKVVGETVNNGVGIASSIINEKGELVLTYTNGETANLGGVVGKDGKDGRDGTSGTDGISISAAVINESGELIISYSDGTTANLGKVVGSDGINGVNGTNGKDGISVSSAEINSEGELVLSFSNGQRANVGAVVGAKGDKGDKGDKGEQGEQGLQGAQGEKGENGLNGSDGIGIKKSEINSAGELVITYTNDLTENLGPVVGAKGDKGDKGDQGVQGEKGEKGERGVQGEKGDAGLGGADGKDGKDGTGINNIEISNDGNLLITLTNGTSLNLGNIKGAKGDQGIQGEKGDKGDQGIQGEKGDKGDQGVQGEKGDAGINGADGKDGTNGTDGVGVASSEINALGELVIKYSNGTTVNLGKVVGNDGAQGAQGEKGEKGDKGDQGIQGEKGDKGDQGIQGEKGDKGDAGINGTNGADGVGVASSEINALGELVITYSDGNTVNLGKVVGNDGAQGAQGEKGEKGDKGDQGIQGEKGDKGDTGENGKDGITPKIRINSLTLEWEVSNDNGQTWVSLNVKAVQAGNQETVGDFVYVLLENGTYGIRASENFNSDSLEIPEKYNGIPVTKIIDNGFKNKTNLTQITLPNSIEIIGRHAFEGCTSLSSITIPDSVTTIGAYSFYKSGVTEVNLSEIDKWVCDKDGMSYHNFTYSSTGFGAGTDVSVYENYVSIDLSNPNKIAKALSEPLNVAWKTSNMSGSFKTELRYIYLYSVDWTKNY